MTESKDNRLLLLGAGHAHMVAMRQWLDQGIALPKETLLINPEPAAWYSGMMPGLVAGRFEADRCLIELQPLCQQLGIEFQQRKVVSLDIQSRAVWFCDGGSLPYRLLSINTGSIPHAIPSDGSIPILPVKPFADFYRRWLGLQEITPAIKDVAIVGGGAAAVEIALALSANPAYRNLKLALYVDQALLTGFPADVSARITDILSKRGVRIQSSARVAYIEHGILYRGDNTSIADADLIIAATGSGALPWYQHQQFSLDAEHFIRVQPTLQAIGHDDIFVSGDACSLRDNPRSGVYAVRHGSVLARNIPARLNDGPLMSYQPQRKALALLSTGNGNAVARYGNTGASHALLRPVLGAWKDHLDTSYIARHRAG